MSGDHHPSREAHWPLLNAVAWVIWRDFDQVQQMVTDRADATELKIRTAAGKEAFAEARRQLWQALQEEAFVGTGIPPKADDRESIKPSDWCDLRMEFEKGSLVLVRHHPHPPYTRRVRYSSVMVPCRDVQRRWRGWDERASLHEQRAASYARRSEDQRHWLKCSEVVAYLAREEGGRLNRDRERDERYELAKVLVDNDSRGYGIFEGRRGARRALYQDPDPDVGFVRLREIRHDQEDFKRREQEAGYTWLRTLQGYADPDTGQEKMLRQCFERCWVPARLVVHWCESNKVKPSPLWVAQSQPPTRSEQPIASTQQGTSSKVRRRRGRKKGQGTFAETDAPFVALMREAIEKGAKSPWEASRLVVTKHESEIGGASFTAKQDRLHRSYQSRFGRNSETE